MPRHVRQGRMILRVFRIGLLALWAVVLMVLAGCATTAANRTSTGKLELDLAVKGSEGFAVLKVISMRPISLLNPKWAGVDVRSSGGSYSMNDITQLYNMLMSRHVPTESLYFAKLPAGQYEVTGLGSVGPGPGLLLAAVMSDHANASQKLPGFKVEAGRLANLGTIVYEPALDSVRPEQMILLQGSVGKKAALDALLAESNRVTLSLTEAGGWDKPASAESETIVLSQARSLVSMLNLRNMNGKVMAGSHLGLVLHRSGPQAWNQESLDTLETVYSIAQTADGQLIAGSAYGRYFVKNRQGIWHDYNLGREIGRVAYIEPLTNGGTIFITGDLSQSWVWLKKSLEDSTEIPTKIATVATPPDNVLASGTEIFIYAIKGGSTITRINKQTLAVSTQPEKFQLFEWSLLPDGRVMLIRQSGFGFSWSSSSDGLKTWEHTDKSAPFSSYWLDANRAVAMDWKMGIVNVTDVPVKTADGGLTWERFGNTFETKHYPGRVIFADDQEIMLQGWGTLYSSIDQGQTWQLFFPLQSKK